MRPSTHPRRPRRTPLALASLGAGFLCALWMTAPATAGTPFDDTTWNLVGTGSARIGRLNQTVPISGTLMLNADRTFTITDSGQQSSPPEEGVWFVNRDRIVFFPQNFLEQIVDLENEISSDPQTDPVQVSLLRYSEQATFNSRTGLLSFQERGDFGVFVVNLNQSFPMSVRIVATGTKL